MAVFNEKILKVTDYKVLGKLPDPFLSAFSDIEIEGEERTAIKLIVESRK